MPRIAYTPDEAQKYLTMLETTASFLTDLAARFDETQCRWSPGSRDWSMIEVLAHLRACAELWSYSIYAMLTEARPTVPLLDERRWAKTRHYTDTTFAANVQVFALERAALVNVLHRLADVDWQRSCIIAGRTHTVFTQTRRMALHEAEHRQQFQALTEGVPKP